VSSYLNDMLVAGKAKDRKVEKEEMKLSEEFKERKARIEGKKRAGRGLKH